MEDAVSTPVSEWLPGEEVPFAKISSAMARGVCQDAGAMRALVATIVAVGPAEKLMMAAETLQRVGDAGTVRGILISEGDNPAPPARVAGNTVSLEGLKAQYVNNAVAALRLSSLPTLVWWRGGRHDTLDGLADLADRVVLDEDDPYVVWRRAEALFDASAFSDVRWARLTEWRALMAHFFDIPEVRTAAIDFTHVRIDAVDRASAALFAAWLTSSIRFKRSLAVEIVPVDAKRAGLDHHVSAIRFGDDEQELVLRVGESSSCIEAAVSVRGHRSASRIVPFGDRSPAGLLTQELRVRARDVAFERAIRAIAAAEPSPPTG
jgi:glucose-6-phosphate dehydrogenase assembly protein OpcA